LHAKQLQMLQYLLPHLSEFVSQWAAARTATLLRPAGQLCWHPLAFYCPADPFRPAAAAGPTAEVRCPAAAAPAVTRHTAVCAAAAAEACGGDSAA
jgi:hypothetical protein